LVLGARQGSSGHYTPTRTHCLNLVRLQRSALSDEQLREEVAALQLQGHRRLLVLTGEHPRYTFDQFLQAIHTISSGRVG